MRREPATHTGLSRELPQLTASGGRGPAPAAGGAVDDAEQRSDRERDAVRHPGRELFEAERVHPGLAALVAFAVPDRDRFRPPVDPGLLELGQDLLDDRCQLGEVSRGVGDLGREHVCCSLTAIWALYPCTNPNPVGIGRESGSVTFTLP